MLVQLNVKDFALIERVSIEPDSGFNVLTGETGAGKSIIIDAVSLLLGGRANTKDIRIGCEKARVEGVFRLENQSPVYALLEEAGLEAEEDLVILQREILLNGKNVCRINDRTVTLATFRSVGQGLINIYGQHDFQTISNRERQIDLLDSMGDAVFQTRKSELEECYRELLQTRRKKQEVETVLKEQQEKKEFLLFKQKELRDLNLQEGEEELLERELSVMDNFEKIQSATGNAYRNLYGDNTSVYALLTEAADYLEQIKAYDGELNKLAEQIREMQYLAEDYGRSLSAYEEKMDFDEEKRNRMNERKYILDRAKRKYQCSIEELISQRNRIDAELDQLEHGDEELEQLNDVFRQQKARYLSIAEDLRTTRKILAEELTEGLLRELKDLAMENTRFEVRFTPCNATSRGMDQIEFFLSANPGQPLRELREIASGGEMSRIMLAFKTVLAEKEQIGTLIFDEIDTGIGGNILGNVAEKIKSVAEHAQVICVTHAPILAAVAHRHFRIQKEIHDDSTATRIIPLGGEDEIRELARMLGGEEEFRLEHARTLKERA